MLVKQMTLLLRRCLKQLKLLKEKNGQIKDCAASTLGTSNEKPHKDDEAGKDEAQYDAGQYDSNVGSILEQLKQKVAEFFGTL
jgi:hypothetical protein